MALRDKPSQLVAWLQAGPMMLVFAAFFLIPLAFVIMVSFWDYNEYEMIPAFTTRGYVETFEAEEPIDLEAVATELARLEEESRKTDETIAAFCRSTARARNWRLAPASCWSPPTTLAIRISSRR